MNKLWLIVEREYLTRVRKRSFILATVLTPLAIGVFSIILGFIASYEGDAAKHVLISDPSGLLGGVMKDDKKLYFSFSDQNLATLKSTFDASKYDGILQIPEIKDLASQKMTVFYYSDDQLGLDSRSGIEDRIADKIREYKIAALHLDEKQLATLDTKISLDPEPLLQTADNSSAMTSMIGAALGGLMGVIMYLTMFIYGMMVMRSVMEEKTSRVVEIMISSVTPMQLMLGKINGVGLVGLTQISVWAVLIPVIRLGVALAFGAPSNFDFAATNAATAQLNPDNMSAQFGQVMHEISALDWWLILPCFLLYFIGGYVMYASLFAAVGSAMGDDLSEGQSLTIPITLPIVIAFYIMFVAVRAPQSNLAVWSSIFPLFSPIVMPARLAFHPPLWQVGLSLLSLAATCYFFIWMSGRIYRVGILMYGKKFTFREFGKWIFSKD